MDEGGVESLIERFRRKPNLRNRVTIEIEKAILALALDEPAFGQVRPDRARTGLHDPCDLFPDLPTSRPQTEERNQSR